MFSSVLVTFWSNPFKIIIVCVLAWHVINGHDVSFKKDTAPIQVSNVLADLCRFIENVT